MAELTDPFRAPRKCVTGTRTNRRFKIRYSSWDEVPDRLKNDASLSLYSCDNCGFLHLGHERSDDASHDRRRRNKTVLHM